MTQSDDTGVRPVPGDFHGHPTLRSATARSGWRCWRAPGRGSSACGADECAANLLAETPDLGWETPHGRYELVGGHRLWFAPEDPERVAVPDRDGLAVERLPTASGSSGRSSPRPGSCRRSRSGSTPVRRIAVICHELRNLGPQPLEIAPWSITQLPLGGQVLLPQRRAVAGHRVAARTGTSSCGRTPRGTTPGSDVRDGLVTVDAVAATS